MHGRFVVLAVALGWVGVGLPTVAQAQSAARLNPASLLLPPVASTGSYDLPEPVSHTPDLPPRAAKLRWQSDIKPVSNETVDDVRRGERANERPSLRGDELFDYLSDVRRGKQLPSSRSGADSRREQNYDKPGDDRSWSDRIRKLFDTDKNGLFSSDHEFDNFVSPISNPFLFEDPRSLTEIRPNFIYQKIPSPQPNFQGGNIWAAALQGRIAITNRFSITLNKIGVTGVNSSSSSPLGDHVGLTELWFGPKVTVIRDEEYGTILAVGSQFHVPLGSGSVYQNTGKLSVVPYATFGQTFLKTRLGSFNTLLAAGYSFSINNARSDYFYSSAHVSYDVGNYHRFYPVAELNWFQVTTNGTSNIIKGEGRDLVNFGGEGKGSSLLTGALGARYKVTKNIEVGAAYEIPLVGNRDFFSQRFTVDLIWRY